MKSKLAAHRIDILIALALLLAIAFAVNQWRGGSQSTAEPASIQAQALAVPLTAQDAVTNWQSSSSAENNAAVDSPVLTRAEVNAEAAADTDMADDALDGAALYLNNCAKCHGQTGAGDGPSVGSLGHISGNIALTNLDAQSAQEIFNSISFGIGAEMPPWSFVLSADERWALVDYVRTLAAE